MAAAGLHKVWPSGTSSIPRRRLWMVVRSSRRDEDDARFGRNVGPFSDGHFEEA